jgi:hypothetical protein
VDPTREHLTRIRMAIKAQATPSDYEDLERSPGAPTVSAVTVRGFILALVALTIVGALVYAPMRHGGFYLDDWSNAADALYPPGRESAVSYFSEFTLYRPVLVAYLPLVYFVFGTHMVLQLVWSAIIAVFASAMLYGVLRTLSVPGLHAWLLAALTLVYPWFDSTRLWATGSLITLSVGFTFAGLWLALVGLERRSWRLHGGAAVLYLMSIWTYEVTLPLIATAGVIYVAKAGWRRARTRWGVDLAVVIVGGLWIATQTKQESFGLSADIQHLKAIFTSGGTILGRTLLPVGEQRTALALAVLLCVALGGVAMLVLDRARSGVRGDWGLPGWMLLAGGGLLMAALGWVMFIPANVYFTPSVYGVTNRVNALAGFGAVICVYGAFGIAGELVARVRPAARHLAIPTTIGLALLLGVAYIGVLERHIKIWNAAFHAELAGIGEMRMQLPTLAPGTTVFTSDYPAYQTLGVPIFSAPWDVNGMIKLQYKNGTLSAYPILQGLRLVCRAGGVSLEGTGFATVTTGYGGTQLLNVHTGEHSQPRSRRECQAVVARYTPGPLYVSLGY